MDLVTQSNYKFFDLQSAKSLANENIDLPVRKAVFDILHGFTTMTLNQQTFVSFLKYNKQQPDSDEFREEETEAHPVYGFALIKSLPIAQNFIILCVGFF